MTRRRQWIYIPTLYFLEGLPYILVNTASVVMYKNMGVSNTLIGLTSLFYLPWVIKMFWGPLVDIVLTKRSWIVFTQLAIGVALCLMATLVRAPGFFQLSLVLFTLIAFLSATHDIAVDGYYMLALDQKDQALYTGIRATFYRLAVLFGSGALVVVAGVVGTRSGDIGWGWTAAIGIAAAIFMVGSTFHRFYLPGVETERDGGREGVVRGLAPHMREFADVFRTYFAQEKVGVLVAFILTYRLGEAFLTKMTAPFLLDAPGVGGLGLATKTVGIVQGTVGVLSLVVGGIAGGWLISRFSLKRMIWPMALALKGPDLVYIYMALAKPSLALIYPLIAIEQLGYGLGFTAFTVVLMYSAVGKYKTSHFAISTGIMALGMMVPGMVSGFAQAQLGYIGFFVLVIGLTLPGLIPIFFLPLERLEQRGTAS